MSAQASAEMRDQPVPGRKLLFLVTEDWYFCSHRLPLAIAARSAGYDVTVVTRVAEHGDDIRAAGLRLVPFRFARRSLNPLTEIATILRLRTLYRREAPDLVHHVAIKPVLYGTLATVGARKPFVVNAVAGLGWLSATNDGPSGILRPVVRRLLGRVLRAGVTIVQNREDQDAVAKLGVAAERIRRLSGAGVDLDQFSPAPESSGPPVVLLAARLIRAKGIGEFVEAARRLKRRGVSARFVLAGEPDAGNRTAIPLAEIQQWVAEGVLEHPGRVKDMPALLRGAHVVCLPTYYGEGVPKSLIEAAACARPIVATDIAGCREIVRHGENGLLVPPRDVPALATALESLIRDPARRARMGAAGRALAESVFALDRIVRETLSIYEERSR